MNIDFAGRSRLSAAAGRFYPADAATLREQVAWLLAGVSPCPGPSPKALIAPHAGYMYSGPIAASAYAQLIPDRDVINRIVLLGPSHFAEFEGIATSSVEAFLTPLGPVPVDAEAVRSLSDLPQVKSLDRAHLTEHSIEVHLPFLQVALKEFTLVPLLAGVAGADEINEILDRLWNGPGTRIVVSSDLSHYLDSAGARRLDRQTADAIESLLPDSILEGQACGRVPIRGLLKAARGHCLRATTLDLRNSGDTGGKPDQVVGYGAFAFG